MVTRNSAPIIEAEKLANGSEKFQAILCLSAKNSKLN